MKIIPVIHYNSTTQLLKNIQTCIKYELNNVFLIDHSMKNDNLINEAIFLKQLHKNMWIGINLLGVPTINAISYPDLNLDGLWSDQSLTEDEINNRTFKGLYFGGLAFKYQPQPLDLEYACKVAIKTTDVATTSGPGTGKPADIKKIENIRKYLGNHPMAIASGVNSENIKEYKNLNIDYVLVASSIIGIINNEEIISEVKLEKLLNSIK